MLDMNLFPNAKEITESFAAYEAVRQRLFRHFQFADPKVVMIAVGDGSTPRTGATFAYRSRWQCHSVDPILAPKTRWAAIDRLHIHRKKIEECSREDFSITDDSTVVVAAVHSHAPLPLCTSVIGRVRRLAIVAIPCCVKLLIPEPSAEVYDDKSILSPHKTVTIWDMKDADQPQTVGG